MVPLGDEIGPVGNVDISAGRARSERICSIPCSSRILTSRTCGSPATLSASLASAAAPGKGVRSRTMSPCRAAASQ